MSLIYQVVSTSRNPELAWYALYTRHQHEKTVADILSRKGFEVFLPLYSVVHRWKDRNKQLSLPLYPGYVFLHDDLERRLPILVTPGVHSIVGTAGAPEPIPDSEIHAVKRVIESSLAVEPYPYLQCGDRVRVQSGPLEGIEGVLVRKKNAYRLVLTVEILMKSVAVEIDASLVERTTVHIPDFMSRVPERMLPAGY
jgi:transcription antitermination factor NusG